jgi:hypothetical protein
MPDGIDEYSDTKNAPDYVEKNKCRMVRHLNAACPLNRVGKQYDGNSEATKREQSESLHIATRQAGERHASAGRRDTLRFQKPAGRRLRCMRWFDDSHLLEFRLLF